MKLKDKIGIIICIIIIGLLTIYVDLSGNLIMSSSIPKEDRVQFCTELGMKYSHSVWKGWECKIGITDDVYKIVKNMEGREIDLTNNYLGII